MQNMGVATYTPTPWAKGIAKVCLKNKQKIVTMFRHTVVWKIFAVKKFSAMSLTDKN